MGQYMSNEVIFSTDPLRFFSKFSTVVELFKELSHADFYFHKSSGFCDTAMWKLKKMMFLRSRAHFQTTIFLVLFDMESCLMAHFEDLYYIAL